MKKLNLLAEAERAMEYIEYLENEIKRLKSKIKKRERPKKGE